ncbi:MAG: hypothetical protein IKN96_02365 [Oscillibacter sp.]|nr:hypothetical protein [Oscillibacter sp.]
MFGYVRPPLDGLPQEDAERFRRAYCGLCHALSRRGAAARCVLNYDFTLLAILLSDGEGASDKRRCIVRPVRPRPVLSPTAALELAADESLILAYWKLRDNVRDDGLAKGLASRTACAFLRGAYENAASDRPEFAGRVRAQLDVLRGMEAERVASIDAPADAFAALLRDAARDVAPAARRRVLEEILYHLGRWVYLIDAADDLKQDAASGAYNPVALRYGLSGGRWTDAARQEFSVVLSHSLQRIAAAFELWDFGAWNPLLERIFYSGLFQVSRAVLDGAFHKKRIESEANE